MGYYVDGFLLAIPKSKVAAYKKIAAKSNKIWLEHGALGYSECVGDDLKAKAGMGASFIKVAKAKSGEAVIFSWIMYKNKAHRNKVNKKVMSDPRIMKMCKSTMPFDCKKMSYGGFKTLVCSEFGFKSTPRTKKK